ncbi:YdeI/OmpD-associated family protein [Hornefia butyriciproducens]|uniref:YdeI/OmpD-associated family protein n=1 Tax=Hornefia butyriciproducens TaxID=2652293 RepID=UPI002A9146DE|nr:YdeI/OmpD-associated family protein [Hornefia butyriciproducens]MDY5423209.1 YdeI/OmpD-associated family protein [Hornefia butyriciproducens]
MKIENFIDIHTRQELRSWYEDNAATASCVCLPISNPEHREYVLGLDAVEEALCFGWVDNIGQKDADGRLIARFAPRKPNSNWTELNKERVRRLEKLGLMTDAGRVVLPDMEVSHFAIPEEILDALQADPAVYAKFQTFPALYQRVRVDTIQYALTVLRKPDVYRKRLDKFIEQTAKGKMYGEWNDKGRLVDY